jgi:hypothetical protein
MSIDNAKAAELNNTAAAKKLRALVESKIKTREAGEAYAAATGAEQGKWANMMRVAAIVGVVPEDWQGDATTQTYIAKTVVNTMIDTVAPKYHSTDVEAWGRIMRGNASVEERAKYGNMSPVTAKSLYGVAHQRRAELRGIISYFGSTKVQAEAMQGLERHPTFRKSGGAQVYFGKLVSAARGYMEKNPAPTTDGLCAAIDREIESMIEKADGPKVQPSDLQKVAKLRELISDALKKLQGIEENKHLSKAVAAAVETMVHENTMIPATPVEDQPKVKRAERRAKVKTASKPAENAAPKGWDAVEGGTVAEDETPRVAPKVKGPRINAKATLDADEMAAL